MNAGGLFMRTVSPEPDTIDLAVEVFAMLADGTRLRLLSLLRDGEMAVGDLAAAVERPQALVSQHLAKLRLAQVVRTRRQGNRIHYRLANEHVRQLVADSLFHAEHIGPGVPAHHRVERPGSEGVTAEVEQA